jgi:arabinofuranan 3-O-arabinosyltransferase
VTARLRVSHRTRDGRGLVAAVLAAACFLQEPGRIVPETKLDLLVDPVRFMGRALRLWQPEAAFGHIQNQAVGYLFPMGPFFAAGDVLGIPVWIVQRAWMAALLVVAFLGALKVAEAIGVGTARTRLAGAASYALSPSLLALLAHSSGGQLPGAVLPWVMLPLVRGAREGSPRRAAALSGVAVVAMGGVNATSTLAVLVLPVLWLLTRPAGPRRRALAGWWALCAGLAIAWWAVPLLFQTRYGVDFVPFTETAAVTTATTSTFEVLRGMGHWLAYLFVSGPWLPGAWNLVAHRAAVAGTVAVTAGGLYGLARRDMPERVFLVSAVALVTAAVGAGYSGALGGPLSGPVQDLLDGALTPLRNVAKLEPALRLPLALGLAHALASIRVADVGRRGEQVAAALVVVAVLAAAASPLVRRELAMPGSFERIPGYWETAARWLDDHDARGRTLLAPAAAFGEYRWGRPLDEPLQPLLRSGWAVRDLIPLASNGAVRLLDAIETRIAGGMPTPGLAPVLARSGIRFVLVRNDLDLSRTAAPAPVHVRRALDSPGLRRVASFGPAVRTGLTTDRLPPDLGRGLRVRALEIYEVEGAGPPAVVYPPDPLVLSGGPEGLMTALGDGDVALAGDTGARPAGRRQSIVTDTLRRRDVDFGAVRNNASYTLAEDEAVAGRSRPPRDRLVVEGAAHQSVAVTTGGTVRASSYGPPGIRLNEQQPFAAFDGDPRTAWIASPVNASRGQWIEATLEKPVDAGSVSVRLLRDRSWRAVVTRVRVDTDSGTTTARLRDTDEPQRIALPRGATSRVRLTLVAVRGFSAAGVTELAIPGVSLERRVRLPTDQPGATSVVLERLRADPFDATRGDEEPSLRRRFTLGAPDAFVVSGTATSRPGPELDALLAPAGGGLAVGASSTWEELPAFAPSMLADGDPGTAWASDPDDESPSIQVSWPESRRIDSIEVRPAPGPVRRPTRVRLLSPAGRRDVRLPASGRASFATLETSVVTVDVVATDDAPAARQAGLVIGPPTGLAELRFPALADLTVPAADPNAPVVLPCGSGPALEIDGMPVPTQLTTSRRELVEQAAVPFESCDVVELAAGDHDVDAPALGAVTVASLIVRPRTVGPPSEAPPRLRIESWGAERRTVSLGPGKGGVLATTENFSDGWTARLGGSELSAVRVDGWRQGWAVPAGAGGEVVLEFGPARPYRLALVAGALAVVALVALLVVPGRPTPPARKGRSTLPVAAAVAMAAAVAFVLGGALVVLVVPFAIVAGRRPRWLPGAAAGAYAMAGLVAVWRPGQVPGTSAGAFGPVAQLFAVTAVIVLVLSLAPAPGDAGEERAPP